MSEKKKSFGILSYGIIYLVLGIGASILALLFLNRLLLLRRASHSINAPISQFLIGLTVAAVIFLLLSINVLCRKNYILVIVLTFLLTVGSVLLKIYYSFSTAPYMVFYILFSWPVVVFLASGAYFFCRANTRELFRAI